MIQIGKIDVEQDGYKTEVVQNKENLKHLSDRELSQKLLQMIIRSVQKSERRNSAEKPKRKRPVKPRTDTNGSEADDERKAYSRCSISFVYQVLESVRSYPPDVDLVKWMGFGEILELDDCSVPRGFVKWIADHVSTDDEEIRIGNRSIKLSPQAVAESLGTPAGELSVDSNELSGKAAFLEVFGLSEVPSIKYFGKLILAKEVMPDAVFCRSFMAVALATLFCPNSSTKISTKYMGALVVVDEIKDRNWSKYIHEWMMVYIKKYLKEPANTYQLPQTLGGCIYHMAVRCLDFIDFGPVQMPSILPRIRVWKGNLIKVFSDMYMDTNGKYGAYPVKTISETCYSGNNKNKESETTDDSLRHSFHRVIGNLVGIQLKEDISNTYARIMKDEDSKFCLKAQELVLQVVHVFMANQNRSGDTLKMPSSEDHDSFKLAMNSVVNSESTVKMPDEEEDDCDNEALARRKRRHTEMSNSSQNSEASNNTRSLQKKSNYEVSTHMDRPIEEDTTCIATKAVSGI